MGIWASIGTYLVPYLLGTRSTGLSLPDTCSPPPPLPGCRIALSKIGARPVRAVEFHGEHRTAKLTVSCCGPLKRRIVLAVQCHRPFGSSIIGGPPGPRWHPAEPEPACRKARKRGSGAGAKDPTVTRYGSRSVGLGGHCRLEVEAQLLTGPGLPFVDFDASCQHLHSTLIYILVYMVTL